MSMNLHVTFKGQEFPLAQTPTYITEMCLVQYDGVILPEVRGQDALRALHSYIIWYKNRVSIFKSEEDYIEYETKVREHVEALQKKIDDTYTKDVAVYVM